MKVNRESEAGKYGTKDEKNRRERERERKSWRSKNHRADSACLGFHFPPQDRQSRGRQREEREKRERRHEKERDGK